VEGSDYSEDAFGMTLGYYAGYYKRKGSVFDAVKGTVNKYNLSPEQDLFNGNISTWVSHLKANPASAGSTGKTDGYQFAYDRLNRLRTGSHRLFAPADSAWKNSTAYRSSYRYDPNGNLLALNRYDDKGTLLDSLEYTYNTAAARKNNRLEKVTDRQGATAYNDDLEGTSTYEYDPIGNLTKDVKEGVQINWNVYGKVSEVKPLAGSAKPHITYLYDAAGNRIAKRILQSGKDVRTLYVRDGAATCWPFTTSRSAGRIP
jgi:hypothetical protein